MVPSRPSTWRACCAPDDGQLECGAQCAPPTASAMAHTSTSALPSGRPGRFRLSGAGNCRSVFSHLLQYTFSCACARYQRQPQLSQTFNCTHISMTNSPVTPFPPAAFLACLRTGWRGPGGAVRDSVVPMGDCGLHPHVVCHAHSAQIVEFSRKSALDTSIERLRMGQGNSALNGGPDADVHDRPRGTHIRPIEVVSPNASPRKFPHTRAS